MVSLFGTDFDALFDAIGGAVHDMTGTMGAGAPIERKDPFAVQGAIQPKDPYAGLTYRKDPFAVQGDLQPKDPYAGLTYGPGPFAVLGEAGKVGGSDPFASVTGYLGGDPMKGYTSDTASMFNQNPGPLLASGRAFARFDQASAAAYQKRLADEEAKKNRQKAEEQTRDQLTPGWRGTGGFDFAGPATADDNQGITGAQIDQFVRTKFSNSPLVGTGEALLQIANKYGVSALMILGIAWKESGMGTNVGIGNIFGITDPNRDQGRGGQRAFQSYAGPLEEIEAAARNLASATYKGKSAAEQIGAWYVGPQAYEAEGLGATDRAGNGTVGDYLSNFIAPIYGAFGKGFQPQQTPTQRAGGNSGQIGSMAGITPGVGGKIMQEFGPTDYAQNHQSTYAYGNSYGLQGSQHPGIDWAVPAGTRVASPLGGTVSIVGNDHGTGYFFTDTTGGGARDGAGEYAVTLDNGDILILGHMSRIDARVGQRVNAGDFIGLSGGSDGDHVHVEYRRKNANGGYTIVDPRQYLK